MHKREEIEINKVKLYVTSRTLKFLLCGTLIQVSTKINVSRLSTASLGKFTEKLVSVICNLVRNVWELFCITVACQVKTSHFYSGRVAPSAIGWYQKGPCVK